jgi:secreted trypsin-like serine protease
MRKKVGLVFLVVALMLVAVTSVSAITNGSPDNGAHPYVGIMVADDADGNPLWRCSGTLISSKLFLTAGHCTEAPAASATIWFAEDIEETPDFLTPDGYPFEGDVDGTTYTHPSYNPAAFYLYDLGVVVLDRPVHMSEYGVLPELGVLDTIQGNDKEAAITAVGYGVQATNPVMEVAERDRLVAVLDILTLNGFAGVPAGTSVGVSGSGVGGDNSDSDGTCFGDSGGPQFLTGTNVVAAVTSFGLNNNCAGTGGGYRVDAADDLDWLYSEFGKLLGRH